MGKVVLWILGVVWLLCGSILLLVCGQSLLIVLNVQPLTTALPILDQTFHSAFAPYQLFFPIWLVLVIGLLFSFYWILLGIQTLRLRTWVVQANQTFFLLSFAVWVLFLCTCLELYGRLVRQYDSAAFAQMGAVIQLLNGLFQGQSLPVNPQIFLVIGAISALPLIGIAVLTRITLESSVTPPNSNTCPICGNLLILKGGNEKGVCAHDHRRYVVAQLEFQPSDHANVDYILPLRFNPYTNHLTIGTGLGQAIVINPTEHPDLSQVAPFHVDIKLDQGKLLLQDYANLNTTSLQTQQGTVRVRAGQRLEIQNQNVLVLGQANFLFHVLGYNDC